MEKLGVKVLSMSTDSCFTHKIWQEEELSKMVEGGVPGKPTLKPGPDLVGKVWGVWKPEIE